MGCRHPRDQRMLVTAEVDERGDGYVCLRCGTHVSRERSLRGRRANKGGRRQSWETARDLGGENREVEGEKFDVTTDLFAVQSKRGTVFPERIWRWLSEIPAVDERIPVLVMRDAPGPGRRRRGLAIMTYEAFRELHG